jgi:hypothetical protein
MENRKSKRAGFPAWLGLWASLTAVSLGALLLALSPVDAQEGGNVPLQMMVPEDTIIFLSFPDLGDARENWKKTALYKIWTDQEVAFAVERLLGSFERFTREIEGEFKKTTGVELDEALEILRGEVSLALLALPEKSGPPKAAFQLEFGQQKDALGKLLDFLKKTLSEGAGGLEEGKVEIEGKEVFTFGDDEFKPHYVFFDTAILVATEAETMAGLLKARGASEAKVLGRTEMYKKVRAATVREGREALFVYASFPRLLESLSGPLGLDPEEMSRSVSSVGVDSLKSIGLTVTFTGDGVSDALYVHAPGEKKGLLKILSLAKTATPHLNLVPADAISYIGLNLDFGKIWDLSFEMVRQFDEEAHAEILKELEGFQERTGVNLREDLIASFGAEISSFSAFPRGGGLIPEGVTVFTLKNPARFEEAYLKLMKSAGLERKDLAFRGRTLRYFVSKMAEPGEPGEPGAEPGERGAPPSPIPGFSMDDLLLLNLSSFRNYFIEGEHLFTSSLAQTLKKTITKIDGADRFVSLGQNPHYRKLRERLPGQPGLIMYSDLRGIFNLLYNTILPFGQLAEILLRKELGVEFENAVLPRAEAVSQHLTPAITGIATLEEGVIVSSYSTTGVTTIGLTATALAGAVAALALSSGPMGSPVASNETMAIASLRTIQFAQEQFKALGLVDQNGNGVGEYGFLQELAGSASLRGAKDGARVDAPFVTPELGFADNKGRVYRNGYYIKVFLPGAEKALSAGMEVPAADANAAPAQERAWCAYAWPVRLGATGERVFFVNQDGTIYQCYNSLKRYGGDNEPAPEAAFDRKGINAANLDAVPAGGKPDLQASDGEFWMPVD